jgi:hypothetical protein
MMENFPNMNQWLEIRDKALEKGLETGCRIAVKLTEKAVEFLDMAETYLPGIKEKLEPLIGSLATSGEETPCCCQAEPTAPDEPASSASVLAPKLEKTKPERSTPAKGESSHLKDQLESLPDDLLTQVFSRNQQNSAPGRLKLNEERIIDRGDPPVPAQFRHRSRGGNRARADSELHILEGPVGRILIRGGIHRQALSGIEEIRIRPSERARGGYASFTSRKSQPRRGGRT